MSFRPASEAIQLADQVGLDRVGEVDATLGEAAAQLDAAAFSVVCARVRAHLDPDGTEPDRSFQQRAVTLSPLAGMVLLCGGLDPEGGAALATALDALMVPPADTDESTPAQRRADALVELARRPLATGELPAVAGRRPQVGVLVHPQALSPQTLADLAEAQRQGLAARRLREFAAAAAGGPPDSSPRHGAGENRGGCARGHSVGRGSARESTPAAWSRPGWADPPWLNWVGPVPAEVAQRIACDADVFRVILDPASGMPLDVGRTHRLVPHWMRRALYARDRGCRWTGCTAPAEWTDAHHLDPWAEGGETTVERCLLLCRHHHMRVHEGGWSIALDPSTGEVTIVRPGGAPYLLPGAPSSSWTGPTIRAG